MGPGARCRATTIFLLRGDLSPSMANMSWYMQDVSHIELERLPSLSASYPPTMAAGASRLDHFGRPADEVAVCA